ncbi:hypothetical protein MMC22_000943 [Lobaria immixta]|nr:hypothetical protein [Lobaria immixta]
MTENHKTPDFHLADGRGYMLDRSYNAAVRLNLQHYLWKAALKFNIHPSIPLPDPGQDARIADVATGTAIWLAEVAHELPNVQLDGFDIDLTQAPPKEWLPSNTRLRHWNIFDDTPDDLLGKYDIVHVRLIVLVVRNSDPRPVIRNLVKLLKPGGYLQWDELSYPDSYIKTIDKSLQTPRLREIREMSFSRGRNNWTVQLDVSLTEEGFQDARLYRFEDSPELAKAHGELYMLTLDEFASGCARAGNIDEASKIHQLLQAAYQESLGGAIYIMLRVVCVARKPE